MCKVDEFIRSLTVEDKVNSGTTSPCRSWLYPPFQGLRIRLQNTEESPKKRTVTSSLNEISMYLLRNGEGGLLRPSPTPFYRYFSGQIFVDEKKDDVNCVSSTSEVFFMLNFTCTKSRDIFKHLFVKFSGDQESIPKWSDIASLCSLAKSIPGLLSFTNPGSVRTMSILLKAGSLKMNTALEYSTRVVQEGGRRCKKSTLNDLVHLTLLRIPLMNPP
jgi:hypothetical protein